MSVGSALPGYLLTLAVGLLFAFWLFPVEFILGEGSHWATPRCDPMTHIIGMRYFLADEWRFPLFQTRLIAPPEGVNIIYTDSLPLFALIAKLLRPLLSEQVNYFGVWLFLCYVLQGIAAVFLVRSLDVKGLLPNLAGTVIALSFPPLLARFAHAALSGHFLILFALGLYFWSVRQQAFGKLWGWFALLCWLALLVHAYLFVMVLGVFCAAAAQEALSSKTGFWKSLVAGAVVAGMSALLMWISGYFHDIGDAGGYGAFGYKSMNVLSPWVPQRSGLFPAMNNYNVDGTGGQHFNYLGFGILLLLATALWIGRSEILSALRKYWGLALVLLGLTLLALSNRIFLGQWEVLTIGGSPPWLLQQFGKSGRFFWPVGYTLMAMGLAVVAFRLRRPFGIALIVAAAVLQFIDAGPLRQNVATKAHSRPPVSKNPRIDPCASVSGRQFLFPAEPWRALIASHGRLTVIPSFHCAAPLQYHVLDLVFHASASATPVNTVYLARLRGVDCGQEKASLYGYALSQDELLIMLSPPINRGQVAWMQSFDNLCRSFEGGYACSRKWGVLEKAGLAGGFSNPVIEAPQYDVGTEIRFLQGGNSTDYPLFGCSNQEEWGTWTDGSTAGLMLRINGEISSDLRLTALAYGFTPNNDPPQTVSVVVNGETVGAWTLRHEVRQEVSAIIPRSVAVAASPMRIVFQIANPSSPKSHWLSEDGRNLGMGVVWLRIDRTEESASAAMP